MLLPSLTFLALASISIITLTQAAPLANRDTVKVTWSPWYAEVPTFCLKVTSGNSISIDSGEGFDCTRISAPLDWRNATDDPRTVSLAVGRYRATQEPYLGVIWYNPGGHGESGTGHIYTIGPQLNLLTNGQYDIISWDPRGINASTPKLTCFPSALDEYLYQVTGVATQNMDLPTSNLSTNAFEAVLEEQLARKMSSLAGLWKQCVEMSGDIAAFMGTESVVRDLDHLSKTISGPDVTINYYGVSYGTLLGQYLSVILPPSRLGRIAIDGVANADVWQGYPTRQLTTPSFADVDATIWNGFAQNCASAGDLCALSSLGSADAIVASIDSLIDTLYYSPATISPSIYPSGSVKPEYARALLFQVAYAPSLWPPAALAFASAMNGNYTLMISLIAPSSAPSLVALASQPATYDYAFEGVACNDWKAYDAEHPPPTTKEAARLIRHNLQHVSGSMGDSLYSLVFCDLWPSESKSRYEGPLELAADTLETPVLILTNTWDPVTPRLGALTALQNLGRTNSRLVEQNGTGHTTLQTPTSTCVKKIVSAYFLNGTLPTASHTYCSLPHLPFDQQF
ncbi:hypothetical protein RQP46_011011 [Phenoliferia psychrophenolica]